MPDLSKGPYRHLYHAPPPATGWASWMSTMSASDRLGRNIRSRWQSGQLVLYGGPGVLNVSDRLPIPKAIPSHRSRWKASASASKPSGRTRAAMKCSAPPPLKSGGGDGALNQEPAATTECSWGLKVAEVASEQRSPAARRLVFVGAALASARRGSLQMQVATTASSASAGSGLYTAGVQHRLHVNQQLGSPKDRSTGGGPQPPRALHRGWWRAKQAGWIGFLSGQHRHWHQGRDHPGPARPGKAHSELNARFAHHSNPQAISASA